MKISKLLLVLYSQIMEFKNDASCDTDTFDRLGC